MNQSQVLSWNVWLVSKESYHFSCRLLFIVRIIGCLWLQKPHSLLLHLLAAKDSRSWVFLAKVIGQTYFPIFSGKIPPKRPTSHTQPLLLAGGMPIALINFGCSRSFCRLSLAAVSRGYCFIFNVSRHIDWLKNTSEKGPLSRSWEWRMTHTDWSSAGPLASGLLGYLGQHHKWASLPNEVQHLLGFMPGAGPSQDTLIRSIIPHKFRKSQWCFGL